ncbi:MAG: 4-(cytidine 5'-diphospho)-2-C-methyl-D-erythritol kinase [bacterium]
MKTLKIKTPAKINLTLEIINKRDDGYHEIKSIMQAVSLYDFLTISVEDWQEEVNNIEIKGNSSLIPYNKSNLAYISAHKFLEKANIFNKKINIFIEKNIPVAAGLAGGSSNAAGVLWGLNELFSRILDNSILENLASQIGSDVNFCLQGGTQLATSRGEKLEKLPTPFLKLIIIKPKKLFISTKQTYEKYSQFFLSKTNTKTEPMISAIKENNLEKIAFLLNNNLEKIILPDYIEVLNIKKYLIKNGCINALMSGSGPSIFGLYTESVDLSKIIKKVEEFEIYKVTSIENGVIPTCNT